MVVINLLTNLCCLLNQVLSYKETVTLLTLQLIPYISLVGYVQKGQFINPDNDE